MLEPLPSLPELLSPAGDWESLRAAVANGADAVYFGLSAFNARHRATNFTLAELPEVIAFLHAHNVRGYVAFNTLVFSHELDEAATTLAAIAAAGADAVIVQDLGLMRLLRVLAPTLPVHASTQATLTEPRGLEFVRALGAQRAILARELSLADLAQIRAATSLPVEVFVHGALCVAYSGQCLTSEALGGRSANRGQCAQACRLPYDLFVDGQSRETGDVAYLLSPQDLAAYDRVFELAQLGVCSLKIEGRLKSPQYVAATTHAFRQAIEAAARGENYQPPAGELIDLTLSFSRGFSHGFLDGANHQVLVAGRFPKSRGLLVGTVARRTVRGVLVELASDRTEPEPIKPGDGVVFDQGHPEQDEQGGRVFAAAPFPSPPSAGNPPARFFELEFGRSDINLAAIEPGALVWKTDDPAVRRRLDQSFARTRPVRREPVDFTLSGTLGGPLTLRACDTSGHESCATWPGPLEPARKHPATREMIALQLDRLGETPFALGNVKVALPEGTMVPKSELNELRRHVTAELARRRESARRHAVNEQALAQLRHTTASGFRSFMAKREGGPLPLQAAATSPLLAVLCRTMEQLTAVLAWQTVPEARPAMVYCDFEDIRRYREAVEMARAANMPIGLATLRVLKPHEHGLLAQIAKAEPEAVLARNLAALTYFAELANPPRLLGDYSLNVTNEFTAHLFLERGLERITPGYDLNWEQLSALLEKVPPAACEVVIHQHMPLFHMEHCVFCHLLSEGTDYRNCGRPCDTHRVELRDRTGAAFPLVADTGCRNTVFNSLAQSAAEFVPRMLALGVRHFRVELLRESGEQAITLLAQYARVLSGRDNGQTTWRQVRALNQLGVTRGTLQAP